MSKFEVGSEVRIKPVKEVEHPNRWPVYWSRMEQYSGTTTTIETVQELLIWPNKPDTFQVVTLVGIPELWLPEWLELLPQETETL